jgi:hypothetical protein
MLQERFGFLLDYFLNSAPPPVPRVNCVRNAPQVKGII